VKRVALVITAIGGTRLLAVKGWSLSFERRSPVGNPFRIVAETDVKPTVSRVTCHLVILFS
jgi:hypothetical protein